MAVKSNGHSKKPNGHKGAKGSSNGAKTNGNGHNHNKDPVTEQEKSVIAALAEMKSYERLIEIIHKNDVTHDVVAKSLKEQLEAMETKFFAHQGILMSSVDVINWPVRQKAIEIYLAITGAVAPKQDKIEHSGVIVYKPDSRIQKRG